jgi:hypothetical protein
MEQIQRKMENRQQNFNKERLAQTDEMSEQGWTRSYHNL